MKTSLTILALMCSTAAFATTSDALDLSEKKVRIILEETIYNPNTGSTEIRSEKMSKNEVQQLLLQSELIYSSDFSYPNIGDFIRYGDITRTVVKSVQLPISMAKVKEDGEIYFQHPDPNLMILRGNSPSVLLKLREQNVRGFRCEAFNSIGISKLKCVKETTLPLEKKLAHYKTNFELRFREDIKTKFNRCEIGTNVDFNEIAKAYAVRKLLCYTDNKECKNNGDVQVTNYVRGEDFLINDRETGEIHSLQFDSARITPDKQNVDLLDKDNNLLIRIQDVDGKFKSVAVDICGTSFSVK